MKILFFVSSLNAGGAERVATTLANAWAERGDDVILVPTYMKTGASFYPVNDKVRLSRLADCPGRRLSRYCPVPGKWLQIRRLIRTTQPDVVVSFLTNVNVNVLIASMGLRVPVIVSERTNPVHSESAGKGLRFLRRLMYRRARYVVMQTQASVEPFRAMVPGIQDVAVVPNPLPLELTGMLKADLGAESGQTPPAASHQVTVASSARNSSTTGSNHLVAMGRLVASKQFDVLIDAFAQVATRHSDWTLTIWGDGPLHNELQAKINALELNGRVSLAGRTSSPWEALSRADVFVMTSRVEGFPNVLLEAMAVGLPCIALDCPSGPAELTCNGQDARLVPLDQFEMLVQAMDGLMSDPAERQIMGQKAARAVRARYGLSAILSQWDILFGTAVNRSD